MALIAKNILSALSLTFFLSCSTAPDGSLVFGRGERVYAVKDQSYIEGCGECHFAFQPGLLPERSWLKMLEPGELEEHFGEFVEFEEPERQKLEQYLSDWSAEKATDGLSKKILRSIPSDETPLRITKTNFYIRKHEEIPENDAVLNNDKVKSFANCTACHEEAEKGLYLETHKIPGYGDY